MKTKIPTLFVLSAFLCSPVLFAQNASTVPLAGVNEQVIQIEVTPADRAAVIVHPPCSLFALDCPVIEEVQSS